MRARAGSSRGSAAIPAVQAFTPGTQAVVTGAPSRARSDSDGVAVGPAGYVVGGYGGTTLDPRILGTTDGRHFRVAARLPAPARYAATATAGGLIWVFGGQSAAGPTHAATMGERLSPASSGSTF